MDIGVNLCPSMRALKGRETRRPHPRPAKKRPPPPPVQQVTAAGGLPPGFCYLKDLLNRPPPIAPVAKKKRRIRPPAALPAVKIKSAPLPEWPEEQLLRQRLHFSDSIQPLSEKDIDRLHKLLQNEPPHSVSPKWMPKATAKVYPKLTKGRREAIDALCAEAAKWLENGGRWSTLRYRLHDEEWRALCGILRLPRPFPQLIIRAPAPWRNSFELGQRRLHHALFSVHPALRRLEHLFQHRFANLLFAPAHRLKTPLAPHLLEAAVDALCADATRVLLQDWLPACADILSDNRAEWRHLAPSRRGDSLSQVQRFFCCVSSLMSLQLRALTLQSLQHLADLFLFYKEGNDFAEPYDDLSMLQEPLMVLELTSQQGKVVPPPETLLVETAQSCLLRVLRVSEQVPRLETVLLSADGVGYLSAVVPTDAEASKLVKSALEAVSANGTGPFIYARLYSSLARLLEAEAERELMTSPAPSLVDASIILERLRADAIHVGRLRARVALNMVQLDCVAINLQLRQRIDALRDAVLLRYVEASRNHNRRICNEFDEMSDRAAVLPEDTAGLVALTQYLTHCQEVRMLELRKMIRTAAANLSFLVTHAIFPAEDVQLNARVFLWPRDMEAVFNISRGRLTHRREVVEAALRERKTAFEASLANQQRQLNELQRKDPAILSADDIRDALALVKSLAAALEESKLQALAINEEESLLNWLPAPFSELHQMLKAVKPFQLLWNTVHEFHQNYDNWFYGSFKDLNATEVETAVRRMHAALSEAAIALAKVPGSKRVAELTRAKVDNFISLLPLLHCVCTPGLCDRHWQQMSAAVGVELKAEDVTSLAQVVEAGLLAHVALFQEVAACARSEMALHQRLVAIKAEWADVCLPCVPYRGDATLATLGSLEQIQLMLDDHILRAQTMHSSPYVKAFEEEMQEWEEKLISMQDILDAWLTCQALWVYLAPIFGSDDISRQMPTESAKFASVDTAWRSVMAHAARDPHILAATDMPNMLVTLRDCNTTLEQLQKGLNEYLEKKRVFFPRFYFLSNDELLEVLSETKDPQLVRVDKCFAGVRRIVLGSDAEIESVESPEGESLVLSGARLVPAEMSVERWLAQLEEALSRSLKDTCREAVAAYQRHPRAIWATHWPAQAVSIAAHIHWTTEAAAALRNNALEAFREKSREQLADLSRVMSENHPLTTRRALSNLMLTDLHQAYMLKDMSANEGVQSYSWQRLLRHYWRDDTVVVGLAGCHLPYGFEYLGCPSSLPLTPTTLNAIRALLVAMCGGLGTCMVAPACAGKTDTCREAARIIARPFIVFNCSRSLALPQLHKFINGAVKANAWLCLEGIERLRPPLVSALSHKLRIVGVATGNKPKIIPNCAMLATSTEALPPTLVSQFRPILLRPPDDNYLCQMLLRAHKFEDWERLGKKLSRCFMLLRDLLPDEKHYDTSLRSLNVVMWRAITAHETEKRDETKKIVAALDGQYKPRLSTADVSLYEAVVTEVFGEIDRLRKPIFDGVLKEAESRGLLSSKSMLDRAAKLDEAIEFSSSVILLGPTLAGKTTCYQVLASALSQDSITVTYKVINPEALTLGRLLGQFDSSGEWSDGVLSSCFREYSASCSPSEHKWIVLDGPVKGQWPDALNTALDDTRTLCLISGEMIKRGEQLRILIETPDLNECSPSLIGRCAIVYFESGRTGWHSLKDALLKITLKQRLKMDEQWELICELIGWLTAPLIALSLSLTEVASDLLLFNGFSKMYLSMLGEEENFSSLWLQNALIFACVWGFGAFLDGEGRESFDVFFRSLIAGENKMNPRPKSFKLTPQQLIPDKGLVFDWALDKKNNGTWIPWMDTLSKSPASQQIVGSTWVAAARHFLMSGVNTGTATLLIGPRGCGKSCLTQDIMQSLDPEQFLTNINVLSGGSSADQVQQTVVGRLDRRRKGVFGPPMGRRCVLLMDDLGSSPGPAHLMRQWLANGHWYSSDNAKLELVDMVLLATCCDAKKVPPRLLSQVQVIGMAPLSETSLEKIFTTKLLDNHLSKGYASNVCRTGKSLVAASMEMFRAAIDATHHQILLLANSLCSVPASHLADADKLSRLWIHETHRVFIDPLPSLIQRQKMFEVLRVSCSKHIGKTLDSLAKRLLAEGEKQVELINLEKMHFGSFMEPDANPRVYDEIGDLDALRAKINFYLRDYLEERGAPLILNQNLMQHATRICRAIQRGHALLVGHPGSGRTTAATIAAIISGQQIYQIKARTNYGSDDWKADIKKVLRMCGPTDKATALMVGESMLDDLQRVEDLCQLASTGEVATLWDIEEKNELQEGMNSLAKSKGKKIESSSLYNYFVERVRENCHIILIIRSDGNFYKNILPDFPPLSNFCQTDYFDSWPMEALKAIADYHVAPTDVEDEEKQKCSSACCLFQQTIPEAPSASFLRLMRCFAKLHASASSAISTHKGRYISGLQKLDQAAVQVIEMREKLQHLRPQLVETSEETDRLMIKIEQDTVEVEARKEIVGSDEAKANEAAAAAQAIKDDCESDLAEAVPALEAALQALDTLKPSDITLVKSMKNPPTGVKLVLEAICVMKGVKPDRRPQASGKVIDDFWAPSLRLIGEIKFLDSLKAYDKDDIPPAIMGKIREKYIHDREFYPEIVRKSSTACEGLCRWVRAIEVYDRVIKIVSPKKAKLAEAEAALAQQMATLNEKRTQLQQVSDKLQTLNDDFAAMSKKKKDLEDNIELCSQKLERAEKLIGGLGGERSRWGDLACSLEGRLQNVTGDSLLAAATVTFLGNLDEEQRQRKLNEWSNTLVKLQVAHSQPFSLQSCIKTEEWPEGWLSEDPYAVESALVAENCDAWPLLWDPDGQAAKWLAAAHPMLLSTNSAHPEFSIQLEKALQEGLPLLVELHEPKIPPILDEVLETPFRGSAGNGGGRVKIEDADITVCRTFRLYLRVAWSTKLEPEDAARVTQVQLAMRPRGLERRLLALAVSREQPPLEAARRQLAQEGASNRAQLQDIERRILAVLSDEQSNILEDETGLQVLTASKALSEDISSKQAEAIARAAEIDAARAEYLPIAKHASLIFFNLSKLKVLHSLYQFSLPWFTQIYAQALDCEKNEDQESLNDRLEILSMKLTEIIFNKVSPALFEKHKNILAPLLWLAKLEAKGNLDIASWKAFLTGENISCIEELKEIDKFTEREEWRCFKTSLEVETIPEPYSTLQGIAKLALYRSMRPHDLLAAIREVIMTEMGSSYLRPVVADVTEAASVAGSRRPVVVGTDGSVRVEPTSECKTVSLGEGQESAAEAAVLEAAGGGLWAVLLNCHLAPDDWTSTLERLAEKVFACASPHFRLILAFDQKGVPLSLLQTGEKVSAEIGGGLRTRVLRCFEDPECLNTCSKEQKTLMLALSFLHAVTQARGLALNDQDFQLSISLAQNTEEWGIAGIQRAVTECILNVRTSDEAVQANVTALAQYYVCVEVVEDEAMRVARLLTPDLDQMDDDLTPESLHLSRSVRWTKGRREAENTICSLKTVFGLTDIIPKSDLKDEDILIRPIWIEKKQNVDKEGLVLLQEIHMLNKSLAERPQPSDLAPRRSYLQQWVSGSLDAVWLGGVSRPKALLRSMVPSDIGDLFLTVALDEQPPLFKGVRLEGAILKDFFLAEAEDEPYYVLPNLQFTNKESHKSKSYVECPLYESSSSHRKVATILLNTNTYSIKWKLKGLVCFTK